MRWLQEIRAWMFEAALPLWGEAGVDAEHGGFREELDLHGRPTDIAYKRTRVACRQVYVFSHAAMLGWEKGDALAAMGCQYLTSKAWMGADMGFARRLTRQGAILDPTPCLYEHAFALFAFAWRHRAARDRDALAWAHRTLDFIEAHLRPEQGLGFLHERPPRGPRLQNPHMHLLEACLAAFEASGEQRFLSCAAGLVALFSEKFFDGRTLGEYFTEDWARAPGEQGRILEPGHHFEWAWILAQYERLSGEKCAREAEALVRFAEAHGVDPARRSTFNRVRDDGARLDAGSRTWPNTERIKGWLALFELTGVDPRAPVEGSVRLLLDAYLAAPRRGLWLDDFDAQGRPISGTAPASTFYHLFPAFAEALRLEARLRALPS